MSSKKTGVAGGDAGSGVTGVDGGPLPPDWDGELSFGLNFDRFCFDFLPEATFFCVKRVLSVNFSSRANL